MSDIATVQETSDDQKRRNQFDAAVNAVIEVTRNMFVATYQQVNIDPQAIFLGTCLAVAGEVGAQFANVDEFTEKDVGALVEHYYKEMDDFARKCYVNQKAKREAQAKDATVKGEENGSAE